MSIPDHQVRAGRKREPLEAYWPSWWRGWRNRKQFQGVREVVLFIGYPRSGHSLVGSLLDAHPNVTIAHELDVLLLVEKGYKRNQLFQLMVENSQRQGQKGRANTGYSYEVEGQWQGRFQDLKVIGDKKGGRTTRYLAGESNYQLLHRLAQLTGCTLKFIHVVRHPMDNISTMVRRTMVRKKPEQLEEVVKKKTQVYLNKLESNARLRASGTFQVLDLSLESLISQPKHELKRLCDFLHLEASKNYLDNCATIIWPQPNKSRDKVDFWTAENRQALRESIQAYDFMEKYWNAI